MDNKKTEQPEPTQKGDVCSSFTCSDSYVVTQENNFGRVFRLPSTYPEGFCFGGGYQVPFQMVDWFNPVPPADGEYFVKYPKVLEGEELIKVRNMLRNFIRQKGYFTQCSNEFILITNYGDAFKI